MEGKCHAVSQTPVIVGVILTGWADSEQQIQAEGCHVRALADRLLLCRAT